MANSLRGYITFLYFLSLAALYTGFKPRLEVARQSVDDKEQWGYSEVREGAHMFWWLYRTTHPAGETARPLIIWLQGGPGFSSCGMGNFRMLGPLNEFLQPRNTTWVKLANVMFVDNPVGAGFSYTDPGTSVVNSSEAVAADLVAMLYTFLQHNPIYKKVPIYIFGQSYGGKMAVAFGHRLMTDIKAGKIEARLRGVALGNAWISPVDSIVNWAPLLLHMSVIDQYKYRQLAELADNVVEAINSFGYTAEATRRWNLFTEPVLQTSVDIYNILHYRRVAQHEQRRKRRDVSPQQYVTIESMYDRNITVLMEKLIKRKLDIIPPHVNFIDFSETVYLNIEGNDFLAPVVDQGAQDWLKRLTWPQMAFYNLEQRRALHNRGNQTIMFVKAHDKLKFYWILDAGHVVPYDTPNRAFTMVQRIVEQMD